MNSSNISDTWSPHCPSQYFSVACILSVLVSLASLIGNAVLIHVIRKTKSLHTLTNYLLAQKSVLDIVLSMWLPIEVPLFFLHDVNYRDFVWSKAKYVTMEYLVNGNLFTILFIAVDRCLAIVYPLLTAKIFRNVKFTMIVIWAAAAALSSLLSFFYITSSIFEYHVLVTVSNVIPMVVISVSYIMICVKLYTRKLPGNQTSINEQTNLKTTKKVIKTLLIMTISFYISWTPSIFYTTDDCIGMIAHFFMVIDGVIMPWVYFSIIEQYKKGLKKIFTKKVHSAQSGESRILNKIQRDIVYEDTIL